MEKIKITNELSITKEAIEETKTLLDWEKISRKKLSLEAIREYKDNLCWRYISIQQRNLAFRREFKEYIDWWAVLENCKVPETQLEEFYEYIPKNILASKSNLSEKFLLKHLSDIDPNCIRLENMTTKVLEKCIKKINFTLLLRFGYFSEKTLKKYIRKINWTVISTSQELSENFIEKYKNKVDWWGISRSQKLTDTFIEKYEELINFVILGENFHGLSEYIIEKYFDKLDKSSLVYKQKLSEDFIERHSTDLCWKYISRFQKLSDDFILNHADKIDFAELAKNEFFNLEDANSSLKLFIELRYKNEFSISPETKKLFLAHHKFYVSENYIKNIILQTFHPYNKYSPIPSGIFDIDNLDDLNIRKKSLPLL